MPEEQNKKIAYKILTAEELIKEEVPATKEIQHFEEEIKIPVIKYEEISKKPLQEEIEKKKEQTESKIETDLDKFVKPKPQEALLIETYQIKTDQVNADAESVLVKKTIPTPPEVTEVTKETTADKINVQPIIEKSPQIIFTDELEAPKPVLKLNPNLAKYFLIGGGLILIVGLIIFLKPYEKFRNFLAVKEGQKLEKEEKTTTSTSTPIAVILPTPTLTPTPTPALTTTTSLLATLTPFEIAKTKSTITVSTTLLSETIPFLKNFPLREIIVQELNFQSFQKEINSFFAKQELAGTKTNIKFLYNQKFVPFDFVFDYFIKPTKISTSAINSFKNALSENYGFLLYYGYTRKYPILIFEIEDKKRVEKFNQQWERLFMRDDLRILFLDKKSIKTKNNFVTKKINNFSYRILDFGDNYKIIWAIINKYLVYSTTEDGIKEIINHFR